MKTASGTKVSVAGGCLALALLCAGAAIAHADDKNANAPGSLRAKYGALQARLSHSPFQQPLVLDSSEATDSVKGEIHALVTHPFATVGTALRSAGNWCEILILHLNTKYCRATTAGQERVLDVAIGKKHDQPLNDAYRVTFVYRVAAQSPDYLQVRLNADEGPLSTRNYRLVLEAIPLENDQTFVRLSYSYDFGVVGRLAMQTYLLTTGKDKVGFSLARTQPDGQPRYIGGIRGVVERNTMRYHLAIEAFLGALSEPPKVRFEKSLRDWFAATERYAHQLHELEQRQYLEMKRKEYLRQQSEIRTTTRVSMSRPRSLRAADNRPEQPSIVAVRATNAGLEQAASLFSRRSAYVRSRTYGTSPAIYPFAYP